MNKLNFALGMVLGGAAVAAAGQAGAATVYTDTFNYAGPTDGTSFSYDVTLSAVEGVTMRFYGGEDWIITETGPGLGVKHHLDGNGTVRFSPVSYSSASVQYDPGATKENITTYSGVLPSSEPPITSFAADPTIFYHLNFSAGGQAYSGSVGFNDDHSLNNVTYALSVPEPSSWALLILGSGLAGAALRRSRRYAQAA